MDHDYRQKLGKIISGARIRQGLTQAELAKKLETSQSAVNRIERGAQNITIDIISRISAVLDCDILLLGNISRRDLAITGGHKLGDSIDISNIGPTIKPTTGDLTDIPLLDLAIAAYMTNSVVKIKKVNASPSEIHRLYAANRVAHLADISSDQPDNNYHLFEQLLIGKLDDNSKQPYTVVNDARLLPIAIASGKVTVFTDSGSPVLDLIKEFIPGISQQAVNGVTLIAPSSAVAPAEVSPSGGINLFMAAVALALAAPGKSIIHDTSNINNRPNHQMTLLYQILNQLGANIETFREIWYYMDHVASVAQFG